MEFIAILRVLWRQRILVAIGALAAIAMGLMAAGGEATHRGSASTRVVLDTPDSQLLYLLPEGADSLGWRASLLATLMASEPMREQVARNAQIRPDRLVVVEPLLTAPSERTPLGPFALEAAEAAEATTGDHVLTVRFDPELPIISIETHAPGRAEAIRLAEAAAHALKKAAEPPSDARGTQTVMVESVGPAKGKEIASPLSSLLPLGISAAAFAFWCAGLALVPGMVRAWRGIRSAQPA